MIDSWKNFLSKAHIIQTTETGWDKIRPRELCAAFTDIENIFLNVTDVWLNNQNYLGMKSWLEYYSEECGEALLKGKVWGARINISEEVPSDIIVVTHSEKEKYVASFVKLNVVGASKEILSWEKN